LDPAATVIKLKLAGPPVVDPNQFLLQPQPDGRYVLTAHDCDISGAAARLETTDNIQDVGYWTTLTDTVSWNVAVPPAQAGRYKVSLEFACIPASAGGQYAVVTSPTPAPEGEKRENAITGTVESTGDWDKYQTVDLDGTLMLSGSRATIRVVPRTMPALGIMNLRKIVLTPVNTR
ncbi:MAG TPA: hypothetical protein VHA37_06620, partial [Candidatus Saccharimonadales bacterium]|nr:hypothetical protein [Candidatus Saccharimonadales bacterium]